MNTVHMAVNHKNSHTQYPVKRSLIKALSSFCLQLQAVMDHEYTHLISHSIIGLTIGASTIMFYISLFTRFWILRSFTTLIMNLLAYGAVTFYYHRLRKHKPQLFKKGLIILSTAALSWLLVISVS
jgi:hypothetical protein